MRVVTYNIHGCVGRDRRRDLARIAAVLRPLDADVIGLQEAEARISRSPVNQARAIAHHLGMACVEGPLLHEGDAGYGNALLTRLPVARVRRHLFTTQGREPRGCLEAEVIGRRGIIWRVFVTHLDLRRSTRRAQLLQLAAMLEDCPVQPTVLLGDLNEWQPWQRHLGGLARQTTLLASDASFPSRRPLLRLDRIAVRHCRALTAARRPAGRALRFASDHLPLMAELDPGEFGQGTLGAAAD